MRHKKQQPDKWTPAAALFSESFKNQVNPAQRSASPFYALIQWLKSQ